MGAEHLAEPDARLARFREQVTAARRRAGRLQKELAEALGLDEQVLGRKLHGRRASRLTQQEGKALIQTLAAWDAITTQAEAEELLSLLGLRRESFSTEEWASAPLNRLEASPPRRSSGSLSGALAGLASRKSGALIPAAVTSLIGRDWAVALVCERLCQPEVRLLTLVGTGGVGKTRLALAVANALRTFFADGVCFVSLASVLDPALVPSAIAQALHLLDASPASLMPRAPQSAASLVKRYLRDQHALLVLDNFEQVLEAAGFVGDLLAAAPQLKVLVTSRAILQLYGEAIFGVPPLEVPDPNHLPDVARLAEVPAIQLFIERARAVQPTFALRPQNAASIARLCARLDGLPLAIELAAARCKLFSPQQVLERLGGQPGQASAQTMAPGLAFLRQEARNVPARQQTLLETLAWSEQLLAPEEQQLLARLSVFLGGWTLEAAEAVCQEDRSSTPVLERLEALVNQSLVALLPAEANQSEAEAAAPRFFLLETIHAYARTRLRERGEEEALQERHAAYYLRLAEQAEPDLLGGPGTGAALLRLEMERDNFRAAFTWAIAQGAAEIAQRLCGALGRFWELRSQFQEPQRWCEAALALRQAAPLPVRAKCLHTGGRLATQEGAYDQAGTLLEQSLALYQESGDAVGQAASLTSIGVAQSFEGRYAEATRSFDMSLALHRNLDHPLGYAGTLVSLGSLALIQGDFPQAIARLTEGRAIFHACGAPMNVLLVVGNVYLSLCASLQGDPRQGLEYIREALLIAQELGQQIGMARSLSIFGTVLGEVGLPVCAAQVCAAVEVYLEKLGSPLPPAYQAMYRSSLERGRAQMDEITWADLWARGQRLSLEEAAALALEGYKQMLST
ncbi:MAG TPA: tetratricopeptide repeat protein [Ktedonobacterales bacterium]|nr:tetratricopeptide repeat protein [Ktedonobacterales bacterium]